MCSIDNGVVLSLSSVVVLRFISLYILAFANVQNQDKVSLTMF